jgi:uncharacterized protein YaiE (UPF0345 family)
MPTAPTEIRGVTVTCKANVYFDGGVVSHSLTFLDGSRKTLGLIFKGSYTFNTDATEKMEIIDGKCRVKLRGQNDWTPFEEGSSFDVPLKSSFEIAVDEGICQYICSFG